jgi:hypothetical protein
MCRARSISILIVAATSSFATAQLSIAVRNLVPLPTTTVDQFNQPFTITGLSGITATTTGSSTYWAVMDNSNKLIRLSLSFGPDGSITGATVEGGLSMSATSDFEGIATMNGTTAYLAEESTPSIRTVSLLDGQVFNNATIPPVFANIRPNFGFESLGCMGHLYMWTANEEALAVDGPGSSAAAGTVVRITLFFDEGGAIGSAFQHAYRTEPWHGSAIPSARSGLCDLVALPQPQLLSLERSFALSAAGFFQTRIFELDLSQATDVAALPALAGATYTPVGKRLLYQGDQQNLEGLTLGPNLGPGRYALIGIVDDGDPISVNRLVAFEISGVPLPPCYPNCDGSTTNPRLTPNDFACFLNAYVNGDSYANCDGSPAFSLSPNDFICYINRFSQGCS